MRHGPFIATRGSNVLTTRDGRLTRHANSWRYGLAAATVNPASPNVKLATGPME
jgi:hypothetical protein